MMEIDRSRGSIDITYYIDTAPANRGITNTMWVSISHYAHGDIPSAASAHDMPV